MVTATFRLDAAQDTFLGCPRCGGVFWRGSHWRRMRALLDGLDGCAARCNEVVPGAPAARGL